jgi:hypothetical protein
MYFTINRTILSQSQPKVEIMRSGHLVSRCSDYIIYSVEAKNIDAVVKAFGPCMQLLCSYPCISNSFVNSY